MSAHLDGASYPQCRCEGCKATKAREHRLQIARNKERIKADPSLAEHGSPSTYTNWGCRCRPCRDAWAESCRRRTFDRLEEVRRDASVVVHGRASTYTNWACRCEPCRRAATEEDRQRYGRYPGRRPTLPSMPTYKPRRADALRWMYEQGAESAKALSEAAGFRFHPTGPHPARPRGRTAWQAAALDAMFPDRTAS